ncbi:polyprenyl synthetase family protein [Kushneria indalinina]|uniref:Farnesyl-diphosphate synthase n=1 Tax=Kushneria indalinina DSM 14324 TaxID=1122140 RepID=A0A3D9DSR2_9GAMM|nr:farnesyl diphosphate synthase [Kushneria indalinina]REC93721.1 farnesyl-diphosphate synthase [Kushneria indalinina DSM 14324]
MTVDTAGVDVVALMTTLRDRIETQLGAVLENAAPARAARLEEAMRYSVLGGGKRLRAILVYAAGQALAADDQALDAPAVAIELIHAYSLVHDDLPCMDDDDLRRGRPTCHRAFDDATALLAGDALQTLAFEVLADTGQPRAAEMVATLARCAGRAGMAGGQALDLDAVGRTLDVEALMAIHHHKTGALIEAALSLGALAAPGAQPVHLQALSEYARAIGLAFQIQDDILDVTGSTEVLGKTQGADALRDKPTYPALLGLEEAQHRARVLLDQALAALAPLGARGETLAALARYMIERDH